MVGKLRYKSAVNRLLLVQMSLIVLLSLLFLIVAEQADAISAALGGLVAFLPMLLFAKKLFAYQGAQAAKKIVRNFYLGEAFKIIVSVVLFTLVFIYYPVKPLSFFLSYITIVMSHWLAPLVMN